MPQMRQVGSGQLELLPVLQCRVAIAGTTSLMMSKSDSARYDERKEAQDGRYYTPSG